MGIFSNVADLLKTAQASAPSSVVGIDIGASSIKVVELESRNNVLTLVTYGEVQLGPYTGKSLGEVVKATPKQQQEALVDVIRESAVQSRTAVFAMPLAASFISNATFTADEATDLGSLVRVEARKLIPASLSEVTLDWAELENVSSDASQKTVLIAAIQNGAIERFNILKQFVGFADAPTEIECFSANRAVTKKANRVIIDFGAASSKMYLSRNGVLQRMHRINYGGANVTEAFAKETLLSFDEAETLKIQPEPGPDTYAALQSVYRQGYKRPLREFKQVFEDYKQHSDVVIDSVLICGGASLFPEVKELVKEAFDVDAVHINPFDNVAYPAFMEDTLKVIGAGFVPALGAALRLFD